MGKFKKMQTFCVLSFAVCFLFFLTYLIIRIRLNSKLYWDPSKTPFHYSALVLGAGVIPDNSPSDILYDRLKAAATLYSLGKVKKIIVSGDNRIEKYNEPEVMKQTLVSLGVPSTAIQPDFAGRRTYDSCYRLKSIFEQKDTVVVTQSFHILRAVFICNQLGVITDGFVSDTPRYLPLQWAYWSVRDVFSLMLSFVDLYVRKPKVVGGEKIVI